MKLARIATAFCFSLLLGTVAQAGTVDPALVGKWFTTTSGPEGQQARTLLWQITPTGHSTMTIMARKTGFLSTNPERWGITSPDSPYELEHGLYQITGPDSFSTMIAGFPADWITWTRVPHGSTPQDMDGCVFSDLMSKAQGEAPQTAFNPALIGLWQAHITKPDGNRMTLVWHVSPSGQSTFITIEILPLSLEAQDGQFKLLPPDGEESEGTYQLIDEDTFEMSDPTMIAQWVRCGVSSLF
jgi:hypothetical protein